MSQKPNGESHIRRMADLLKQGATLTELGCPACASPLFRLRSGELWCEKCQRRVIVVKEGEEPKIARSTTFDRLEATLLAKVQELQVKMEKEQNSEELQKLADTLSGLLENLERTRKIKKT